MSGDYSAQRTILESGLQVALVSSGLSDYQRAPESFIAELHEALRERTHVTLFKGAGWSAPPDVYVLPSVRRSHPIAQTLFPQDAQKRYALEQITMALSGCFQKHWRRVPLIHFCDLEVGNVLFSLRSLFRFDYKLLFTSFGNCNPLQYRHFDHIQVLTPNQFESAKAHIRKSRLSYIPLGVWPERFLRGMDTPRARHEWNIPEDAFVVLSIGSLDDETKRLSFLIETLSALKDPRLLLVLAGPNGGSGTAQKTVSLAEALLPGQFRQVQAPYLQMPELYRASDVVVLPATAQPPNKVPLEVMASRTPLLLHHDAAIAWQVPAAQSRVNMNDPDAIRTALMQCRPEAGASSAWANAMVDSNEGVIQREFQWAVLQKSYLEMYERILVLPG